MAQATGVEWLVRKRVKDKHLFTTFFNHIVKPVTYKRTLLINQDSGSGLGELYVYLLRFCSTVEALAETADNITDLTDS